MLDLQPSELDFARVRSAGKDLLSLLLMDARNQTLRWIAAFEAEFGSELGVPRSADAEPPLWTLGHIGWFQERWIGRNLQRQRGEQADGAQPTLASIQADADRWYDPALAPPAERWRLAETELPDLQASREVLAATLDTTLDLLDGSDGSDAALYFYRLALFHEDLHSEAFGTLSQTLGFDAHLLPRIATFAPRSPLLFPATRWRLGASGDGFAFDNQKPAHAIAVPEFEIDAQPVTWAQYGEFVEDGGYDERAHWSAEGWDWLQGENRRTPRHVDQLRHGVLQRRFGQIVRVPPTQPAVHVNWFEADAWCRWAARRLPSEVEWEVAAHQGAMRGFVFGDVREWTASTFRPYPGFVAGPDRSLSEPAFGSHKVLRGASFATAKRLRGATLRAFERPHRDAGFFGFRSCSA